MGQLPGAGALHLRQAAHREVHRLFGRRGIAAGGADQAARRTFLIVQQRLQQVLRRNGLVVFA